jgi:hypothetical protein
MRGDPEQIRRGVIQVRNRRGENVTHVHGRALASRRCARINPITGYSRAGTGVPCQPDTLRRADVRLRGNQEQCDDPEKPPEADVTKICVVDGVRRNWGHLLHISFDGKCSLPVRWVAAPAASLFWRVKTKAQHKFLKIFRPKSTSRDEHAQLHGIGPMRARKPRAPGTRSRSICGR